MTNVNCAVFQEMMPLAANPALTENERDLPTLHNPVRRRRNTAIVANNFIQAVEQSNEDPDEDDFTGPVNSNELTRTQGRNQSRGRGRIRVQGRGRGREHRPGRGRGRVQVNNQSRGRGRGEENNQRGQERGRTSPRSRQNNVAVRRHVIFEDLEVGSPTIQVRRSREVEETGTRSILDLPIDDVVNLDDTREGDVAEIMNFIPAVQIEPTVVERSDMPSLSAITDGIKELRKDFISNDLENPLLMEVRRQTVLKDALSLIRLSQEDLSNPLRISFLGEPGVDLGGLRREFWSLFLHQLSHSCYMKGSPGAQTLRKNEIELQRKTYYHLGQLVALSVLEDGPGIPLFAEAITDYILHGKILSADDGDLGELKEPFIKMMNCSSDEEIQEVYIDLIDETSKVGFLVPVNQMTKGHLPILKQAIIKHQVKDSKDELDDFIKGLETHFLLSFLRREDNVKDARALFSGKIKPVTAVAVRNLLKFKYSEGNAQIQELNTAQGFIAFLQASKGGEACVNGIEVKPENILMWLTGSTHIPAAGFLKPIDVSFGDATLINTCILSLTLKLNDMTIENAVKHYTECLINSQTFTME